MDGLEPIDAEFHPTTGYEVADESMAFFLEALRTFPRPVGMQGIAMTERERWFYLHGFDAGRDTAFGVAMILELKGIGQAEEEPTKAAPDGSAQTLPPG